MTDFQIQLQNLTLWEIPILLFIVLVMFLSFRKISSETPERGRLVLLILRSIFFIWLAFLTLKPFVNWNKIRHFSPTVIFWMDNSASMKVQKNFSADTILTQFENLQEVLEKRGAKVIIEPFGTDISQDRNSFADLTFDEPGTDLSQTITRSLEKHTDEAVCAAILFSDGVSTQGEEPGFIETGKRFPIFSVGIGDTARLTDAFVANLEIPAMAKVGDTIQISAEIVPQGDGGLAQVFLKENGRIIQKKTVERHRESFRRQITFSQVLQTPGESLLSVEIDAEKDINPYNNTKAEGIYVKATDETVVILSSMSNVESTFLKKTLESDRRFRVYNLVESNDGWIPKFESKVFRKNWVAVILIGYPAENSNVNRMAEIRRRIQSGRTPVLVMDTPSLSQDRLNGLFDEKLLVGKPENSPIAISVQMTPESYDHTIFRDIFWENDPKTIIRNLPPVGQRFKKLVLADGFENLITSSTLAETPILAVRDFQGRRLALCTGFDLWRWSFMTTGARRMDFYQETILRLVNWLADTSSSKNVRIALDKSVYLSGEIPEISALAFDGKGIIRPEMVLQAEISDNPQKKTPVILSWDGQRFTGKAPALSAGNYRITTLAFFDTKEIGHAEKTFTVIDQPVELAKIMQNSSGLAALSFQSGGKKVSLSELDDIAGSIQIRSIDREEHHELRLWRSLGAMLFLIFIIGCEWIYRRILGYQ
ncbi:MAG: hypothetical protein PHW79_07235 [Candidatus Marinimicrobia bacterium]|nr:hypothetical protein [Candidatus Neomarinimicrobiota bacterium]